MLKRIRYVLALALLTTCSQAQSAPAAAPDMSKEGYVVERHATKLVFQNDGSDLRETELRIRIQSDAAVKQFGQLAFSFQSSSDRLDIVYVRVRKPDGTVVVTPPGNVLELPAAVARQAPIYSDLHEKHVTVKALDVGDTLEVSLRQRTLIPVIAGQFWAEYSFAKDEVTLDEELQIDVPRERVIILKTPALKPVAADAGPRRVYTWKTSNLVRRKTDEQPRQRPGHAPLPDVQLTTFSSWEQVGRWYGNLQKPRIAPTPEIRAKAADLTRDAKTDQEKLIALYRYVSTKFRYVALEFGAGRFQPHAAADVFADEYGDCKDKHTLFAALADAVGITVYPALVNSTRELDPEVPYPGQFDHVVTAVAHAGSYTWADTTAEIAPFGLISPMLRGKSALVISDPSAPALASIPATPPIPNQERFEANAKLSAEGVLEGTLRFEARGDDEVGFRLLFRSVPQAQWVEAVQQLSYRLGYGGEVSAVEAASPEDAPSPYRYSYHYKRAGYSDWENRRITPPFPPIMFPEWKDDDKTPGPLLLGTAIETRSMAELELPAASNPELPKPVHLTTDFADYDAHYTFEKGTLRCERHLVVKRDEVPVSQKLEYQKFYKAVQDDAAHYISLGLTVPAQVANPEVDRLMAQAENAFNREDYVAAVADFKRILQLDPDNLRARGLMGLAYLNHNDLDEAITALRRAEELEPENIRAKTFLLGAYLRAGRREDADRLLAGVGAVSGDGPPIAKMFENASVSDIPILQTLLLEYPNSVELKRSLDNAYLRAGDKRHAALAKAVELDPGPANLAKVVSEMVLLQHQTPEALRLTRTVLDQAESESAKTALDSFATEDLVRVNHLAAYWGVLGWIYLQQGELAKAASYLEAGWMLAQDPITGIHLAMLYDKQHKTAAAAKIRRMARAARPGALPEFSLDDRGAQPPARRSSPPAFLANNDAITQLSQMRGTKLPQLKGKGSAEVFLLLTPGPKVEAVKFISGTETLRSAVEALKAAKLNVSFPEGSAAKLIRRGILVCDTTSGCTFVLFQPDSVVVN